MKIIHFSDLHLWTLRPVWSDLLYPKRVFGGINLWLRRRPKFPPALAEAVVGEILKQDAEFLIFTGDITTQSHPDEFKQGAELFEPLFQKWGDRFLMIPGNHDRYTPRSIAKRLYENHFPTGAFPKTNVRVWPLSDTWSAVGFDASTAFKFRSNGLFTDTLGATLSETLAAEAAEGKKVVLIGHYPYAMPDAIPDTWEHKLIGKEKLEMVVAAHKPPLYLHGHKHQRWVLQPLSTPDTICIDSGSAGMLSNNPTRMAGFVMIDLAEDGTLQGVTTTLAKDAGGREFRYSDVAI